MKKELQRIVLSNKTIILIFEKLISLETILIELKIHMDLFYYDLIFENNQSLQK